MHCAVRWRLIDKQGWSKKKGIGKRLVTNRLKWAGDVGRMGGERLAETDRQTDRQRQR